MEGRYTPCNGGLLWGGVISMIKGIRRWWKQDDGVTAVEFSLVCMPMFLMIFGIMELSMFFASSTVLEGASTEAARRIRTGQVAGVADGLTTPAAIEAAERAAFEKLLCDNVGSLIDCTNIQYEVIKMNADTFADSSNYEPQYDDEGNLIVHPFDVGGANSVILIRAYYKWRFMTPMISSMLTAGSGVDYVSQLSTVVIRTEPYESN